MGVPTLGCDCDVCQDALRPNSPNRRTRPSLRIDFDGHTVIIDTGPDFHAQAVRERINHVDAVLYTHGHADHILGMDDLRPLTFRKPDGLPLFADDATAKIIERVFEYTFRKIDRYPTAARVVINRIDTTPGAATTLFGMPFQYIPVTHGRHTIAGYRFGSAAYLTDMSDIPPQSIPLLQDLDILILDALRHEPHPSHSHLANSVELATRLKAKRTYFTHISHYLDHDPTNASLPGNMRLAHDGLQLTFDIGADPPL